MKFYVSRPSHYLPPRIEYAMINISYTVVDAEGARLRVSTWTIGRSSKLAFKHWLARRPDIAKSSAAYEVVTELIPKSRFEPIGERVDVEDRSLAACR